MFVCSGRLLLGMRWVVDGGVVRVEEWFSLAVVVL